MSRNFIFARRFSTAPGGSNSLPWQGLSCSHQAARSPARRAAALFFDVTCQRHNSTMFHAEQSREARAERFGGRYHFQLFRIFEPEDAMTDSSTKEPPPDGLKISKQEARQLLAQRVKRLESVGIAGAESQQRAAQTLWPMLFARARAGALDPC